MSTTKKSTEQVPFLERPIVRTILPIAGFAVICILFAFLTDGRLFQPKNLSLLLSQSYMLLISSIGVFMVMTMGGLDFSQGSMLGVASIVVCWLSHYNMVLAAIGGIMTGGLIGLINGYFNVKRKITSFIVYADFYSDHLCGYVSCVYLYRTWVQAESDRCRRNCCKICRYPGRAYQDPYLYGSRMHYRTCRICKCD